MPIASDLLSFIFVLVVPAAVTIARLFFLAYVERNLRRVKQLQVVSLKADGEGSLDCLDRDDHFSVSVVTDQDSFESF